MVRSQRKKVPRISRLFRKAVRYLQCNNQRRLFDLLRREPELLNYLDRGQTWLSGQTLLSLVVHREKPKIEIVERLLHLGANPDLNEQGTNTPLIHAAADNNVHLARLLLDFGADIEKSNEDFETPLGYACTWDAVDVVQLLCEYGANVNGTEGWGSSYLWYVECGVKRDGPDSKSAEIERILLSYGAKVIHEEPKLRWDETLGQNVRIDTGQPV
jgi:hypothetical protein